MTLIKQVSYLIAAMAAAAVPAQASCDGSGGYVELSGAQIRSLVNTSIVCYPAVPPYTNQEAHAGGIITDYKQGPTDPVDPSVQVGTYTVPIGPTAQITYSYTGGGTYAYTVWGISTSGPGSYDFCGGSPSPLTVRVVSGSGPC